MKPNTPGPKAAFTGALLRLATLGLVLFALLACTPQPSDTPQALDPVTLQLKWKHQFQFAGYYAALEQGYYRDAGLDVQLLESPDDIEPAQVVLEGDADFGIATSDLVLLRAQGKPVVALAAIYQHSPLVLLTLVDENLESVHDLAGKTVMIEPHAAELLAYLESEGIPSNKLSFVPHTFDPNALILGQVDAMSAYSTDEPFLLVQAGMDYQIFNPRAGGIDFYGDTLFTTEDQVRDHPERVKAFLEASLLGWEYALDHPDEMVDLIYTHYSQRHSREHLTFEAEQTQRLILPDVVELGYMNPGRWGRISEIYAELGMAPPDLSLDWFLYERNPRPDLTWLYLSLLGALGLLGLISFVAVRFYRLNTNLHQEMDERVRTEANLRGLEERYRNLVEKAPYPIVITRLDGGGIHYINPQSALKFGVVQDHVITKDPLDFYKDPADREKLMALQQRQGYVDNFEVQLVTTTGQSFWANLSANLITYEGQPAVIYSVLDVTERKELSLRLESMAMTDELTGLANRRHFTQRGSEEFSRARRYQTPLSLLMLDTDKLKHINDTWGHEAGDEVLRQAALIFKQSLREADVAGRLGGDEFGILLPNTKLEAANRLAERLRGMVAESTVEVRGELVQFAMSIGAAELTPAMDSLDDLFREGDLAMYQDKASKRDQM